jgi:multidrug resistance efflux pump
MLKRIFSYILTVLLLTCPVVIAYAQAELFVGTVEARTETVVLAPIGGLIDTVNTVAGQRINVGDVIASFATTKIYADRDGKVTAVFGETGDSVSSLESRYGGVLYYESDIKYTIAANTSKAYDDNENKMIHLGEKVFLSSYSDASRVGEGVVTSISGASYTVEVTSGEFKLNETITVYRSNAYTAVSRIGRGTVSRTAPIAVTGTGSITDIHVQPGALIHKGDLLLETLDGEFDGSTSTGHAIISPFSGIVSSVKVTPGSTSAKNSVIISVYEDNAMWIAAQVPETDLGSIHAGDVVEVEFSWNDKKFVTGNVLWISSLGVVDAATEVTNYTAYIAFQADSDTRCGLNVTVSTIDVSDNSLSSESVMVPEEMDSSAVDNEDDGE